MDLQEILLRGLLKVMKKDINKNGMEHTMSIISKKYDKFELLMSDLVTIIDLAEESYMKNCKKVSNFIEKAKLCGLEPKDIIKGEPYTYTSEKGIISSIAVSSTQKALYNIRLEKMIIEYVTKFIYMKLDYTSSEEEREHATSRMREGSKKAPLEAIKNTEEFLAQY